MEAEAGTVRTVTVPVPRWAEHAAALLLAAASLLLGMLVPLTLLEAAPETFPGALPRAAFAVAAVASLPLLAYAALRAPGAWKERARLAAATAVATTVSLVLPEAAGLAVLCVTWALLVVAVRSVPARAASASACLLAGLAFLAAS